MTSYRKIEANRINARTSTGPKTAQGKARAARNARRHGLSVSITAIQCYPYKSQGLPEKLLEEPPAITSTNSHSALLKRSLTSSVCVTHVTNSSWSCWIIDPMTPEQALGKKRRSSAIFCNLARRKF